MEVLIDIEVDKVHRLASRLAPLSNPGCVKRAWIKDTMEEFSRVGLAKKVGSDKYIIHYSVHEPRPAIWFTRMNASVTDNVHNPNGSRKIGARWPRTPVWQSSSDRA